MKIKAKIISSHFLFYLVLSGMLHAGLLVGFSVRQPARIEFQRGHSAVKLNLNSSAPAQKSQESPPEIEQVSDIKPFEEVAEVVERENKREDFYYQDADFTEIDLPEEKSENDPAPEEDSDEQKEMEDEPEEKDDHHDAPDAPGDVREEGVTSGVERKSVPRPQYPRLARRRGHEGDVAVKVFVDSQGRPDNVKLIESSGYNSLDNAAIEAAGDASFQPAQRLGRPVESDIILNFRFRLEDAR